MDTSKKRFYRIVDLSNGETIFRSDSFDETNNKFDDLTRNKNTGHLGYIRYYADIEEDKLAILKETDESESDFILRMLQKYLNNFKSKSIKIQELKDFIKMTKNEFSFYVEFEKYMDNKNG